MYIIDKICRQQMPRHSFFLFYSVLKTVALQKREWVSFFFSLKTSLHDVKAWIELCSCTTHLWKANKKESESKSTPCFRVLAIVCAFLFNLPSLPQRHNLQTHRCCGVAPCSYEAQVRHNACLVVLKLQKQTVQNAHKALFAAPNKRSRHTKHAPSSVEA